MHEIYVIHPAIKIDAGETWKEWVNAGSLWIGNWLSDSKLGDLGQILPTEWKGTEKDNYLKHFRNRKFRATAGAFGEYAARTLRRFYLIPIGSTMLAAGHRKVLGIARISSKVKYDCHSDDTGGSPDERYVRTVNEWMELDIPIAKFPRKVRNKLSIAQTLIVFPQSLVADFLATVERENGVVITRRIESLFSV